MTLLQVNWAISDPVILAAQLVGTGVAAAAAAALVALVYRWYVRERVPTGLGVLFGLTVVTAYLGTKGALGAVISDPGSQSAILRSSDVLPNLAAFALGALGSSVGIRVGDVVGTDLFAATGGRTVDADVSEIVQTVGRVTSVKLPEDVDDIVGYDPMPAATKQTFAGKRFLFPRRLTKTELRERLVSRLKTDYGVGHVDLELEDDGTVEYIAVGSRAAGIGPTLPPATNAVAVRADPAHAASSGDLVQVWDTDPAERVLTGELRGVAGDVVTIAVDADDTSKLDPTREYKLVTLPVQDRPDREFASLLRAADETMGTIAVPAGSELVGTPVGELGVTVAAITGPDRQPEPIPSRDRVLDDGDVVYAIATPEALRRVEAAAGRTRPPEVADAATDESGATDGDLVGDSAGGDDAELTDEDARN
ncbi:TrkA C-terminal domain-containing protein [Haloarcula laminariae]|uniref:TrkA C-terminal domain-containing protein n=1 Tax=Haloarcula laminariae TaxID=2961577 RepID=UPI003D699B33